MKKRVLSKSERRRRKEKIVSFCILFVVCIIWIFPLVYMLGNSFKSDLDLQTNPQSIFPTAWSEWTLDHYTGFIIRDGTIDKMPIWMLNSIWSTLASVFFTVAVDLATAYALVFMNFKGKKFMVKFLLIWMAVPGVIGTASNFAIYAKLRSLLGITSDFGSYVYIYFWIIIPGIPGIFNLLLMKSFFESIPRDIIDSARSDGASNSKIFFKIVCPLAKSTAMLIILFSFVGGWNNLLWPQLLFSGENPYFNTITVALTGYTGGSAWGQVGVSMATSVFSLIPIMIVFAITQNKMIDGLATTGVKR